MQSLKDSHNLLGIGLLQQFAHWPEWISPQATSKHPTHFSTSSYKKVQVRSCHCWSHWTSLAINQAAHRLQNSCSCFQIHSPPDTSIHIRHASRTVQCQTATLQFVIFTSFCWISHPVLNLCWQIPFPAMVPEFGINYRNISNALDQ